MGFNLFLSFFVLFFGTATFSFTVPFMFIRQHIDSIAFTTSTQTINAKACSGVVTVQNRDGGGTAKNIASTLTVTLSASTGVTYFSDSNCTVSIASANVLMGTSSTNFYFLSATTGAKTLTASATGYLSITQNETITVNPYVWTGLAGGGTWNTPGNWSGGSVPTATQTAVFDATCSSCAATISAVTSVGGIRVEADYSNLISHVATLTVGGAGYVQQGGTFVGGSTAITLNGNYVLTGGTFTNTSGTFRSNLNFTIINSPTYNHNGGLTQFQTSSQSKINVVNGTTFNNIEIFGNGSSSNITFNGNISVSGFFALRTNSYLSAVFGTSTISVAGDVIYEGGTWSVASTLTHKMVGTGTIIGGSGSVLGNLIIDTPGTVTFATTGNAKIAGNFTYVTGAVVTTNSLVSFTGATQVIDAGAINFNDVTTFPTSSGYPVYTITGTLNVLGSLNLNSTAYSLHVNGGPINVGKNLSVAGTYAGGSSLIRMVGAGTIAGAGTGEFIGSLEIATAGTITFATTGTADIAGDFTYTSGTVITTGSTVRFVNQVPANINSGTMAFQNLGFYQGHGSANIVTGTVLVNGNLSFDGYQYYPSSNGGTYEVLGNVSAAGTWAGGTSLVVLKGATSQTISKVGTAPFPGANIAVNNPASVLTLVTPISLAVNQGLVVTSGAINMAGYALSAKTLTLNSNTLTKNGGVLTVNGSVAGAGALYGGTVAP